MACFALWCDFSCDIELQMDPAPHGPVPPVSDSLRMERMQRMFDAGRAVFVEDYEHFSGVKITPHEDMRPSKVAHKSAAPNGPQSQEPS